jgi:ectoine hydroxylase-related dioxygenase (phytanoyl-CoA dioxygenase family)
MKKYSPGDSDAHEAFVREGFVIYKDVYETDLIEETRRMFFDWYGRLERAHEQSKIEKDVNGWAVSILDKYEKTSLYERFITNPNIVKIMQGYLGPDICALGYDALWINVPQDKDPVLNKAQHTDTWTGTSIYSVFAKTFITDVDKYNGMSVSPGSHAQGLIPVRNREIDPMYNLKFENVNLDCTKMGDLLIWHPLLVHATTGHSDKNIRMSITSRFTSTETPFSSQERALGYRTLSVGPMNQVLRLVGNDQLQPLRTYGGFVGIDRRMSKIYGYSDFKKDINYSDFLED